MVLNCKKIGKIAEHAWTVMHETLDDSGAGLGLALTTGGTQLLSDTLEAIGIKRALNSVYYVASLFTYPSFFTTARRSMLEGYYQLWRQTYAQAQWQTMAGTSYKLAGTLETQRSQMAFYYPRLFDLISNACQMKDTDTGSIDASYNDLTDREKATAAIIHALNLIPVIPGTAAKSALALGSVAEEHAKDVAAIILTALPCTNVQPDPALGYTGIPVNGSSYSLVKEGKAFQSGQTKPGTNPNDPDHYLCKDHDAMLFPTPDFMKYIYKGVLMHPAYNKEIGFQYFGKWPVS